MSGSARPNTFLQRAKHRRVAAFVAGSFPRPGQVFAYEMVRQLAQELDAEFRFVYAMVTDPAKTPVGVKFWLEHGLISPGIDKVWAADVDHFERTAPRRWHTLVSGLCAALNLSIEELLRMPDFGNAVSQARWLEAWAPDLLISFFAFEGSLSGRVSCTLLDLPHVHYHDGLRLDSPSLLPRLLRWNLTDVAVVVVPGRGVQHDLLAAHPEAADKLVCMEDHDWSAAVVGRAQQALARRLPAAARSDLGIAASARTVRYRAEVDPGITPFVVIGAERTGSNLLIDMLLMHGQVASAGEIFNTQMIDEGRWDTQLHGDLDPREFMELRTSDPGRCIDRLFALAAGRGNGAAGFKLLYFHGIVSNRVVDHLLAMPSLRVVHLVRENRLARWISHLRAERSGQWWVASDVNRQRGVDQVQLPSTETLENLLFVEQLEQRFQATFAHHWWLEFSYEQLAADLGGYGARVLDFLGVERRPLQVLSQKTGDRPLRDMVANWQAMEEAFRGTRWRHLFDE